ncbi:MAG: metal-sensing transcriptional repressor [Filifactoraceae bacterium]
MRAEKKPIETLLKTAKGQVEGILKMVEDDRYCIDISTQIMATIAILKKANTQVLKSHIEGCVKTAIDTGDIDEKLEEIKLVLEKLSK